VVTSFQLFPYYAAPAPCAPCAASDLLWLWCGPHGWRTLVAEAGWSWDSAEAAIRETAIAALYDER
jgi:hypothetical protein